MSSSVLWITHCFSYAYVFLFERGNHRKPCFYHIMINSSVTLVRLLGLAFPGWTCHLPGCEKVELLLFRVTCLYVMQLKNLTCPPSSLPSFLTPSFQLLLLGGSKTYSPPTLFESVYENGLGKKWFSKNLRKCGLSKEIWLLKTN